MTVSLFPTPLPQAGKGRFVSRWRDFHGKGHDFSRMPDCR